MDGMTDEEQRTEALKLTVAKLRVENLGLRERVAALMAERDALMPKTPGGRAERRRVTRVGRPPNGPWSHVERS